MAILSNFIKSLRTVFQDEKPEVYVCPQTGKVFQAGLCYDAAGHLVGNALGAGPYVGEIMLFAGNFVPLGYASCSGQLMAISENDALFALIGTTYGGDGQTTFAMPDLRGRIPIGAGQGAGLPNYTIGEQSGSQTVTITAAQMPTSVTETAALSKPRAVGTATTNVVEGRVDGTKTLPATGGGQSYDIVPPFLGLTYCIALYGIFPSQP